MILLSIWTLVISVLKYGLAASLAKSTFEFNLFIIHPYVYVFLTSAFKTSNVATKSMNDP